MLETLYTCWHIIQYVLYGIFALFHIEEAMILLLASKGVPIWVQIVLMLPFNTVLIGIEVLVFKQIRRLRRLWCFVKKLLPMKVRQAFNFLIKFIKQKFFKQTKNNRSKEQSRVLKFLTSILKGRPIGRRVIFSLGVFPEGQKFGSCTLALLWERLGLGGFVALCLGGACRVTIMIFIINTVLPTRFIWIVVVIFTAINLISWLIKRNKKDTSEEILIPEEDEI